MAIYHNRFMTSKGKLDKTNFTETTAFLVNNPNKRYSMALGKCVFWNSIPNIDTSYANQDWRWYDGAVWHEETIVSGNYSIAQLSNVMKETIEENGGNPDNISLIANNSTLRVDIYLLNGYQLDLSVSDINVLLGYNKVILTSASNTGSTTADISMGLEYLILHCSAIDTNYSTVNGKPSQSLTSLTIDEEPGYQIKVVPTFPVFTPCSGDFSQLTIRLTDQDENSIVMTQDISIHLIIKEE